MQRLMSILFPKVFIDDALFARAPTETLRVFSAQLQSRLNRLEYIVIASVVVQYFPLESII